MELEALVCYMVLELCYLCMRLNGIVDYSFVYLLRDEEWRVERSDRLMDDEQRG